MFKFANPFEKKESNLERITAAWELKVETAVSKEDRDDAIKVLKELYALREKENSCKRAVSPDTLVTCGTSLASILLMLNYEKLGVIRSKALSFIIKGRV